MSAPSRSSVLELPIGDVIEIRALRVIATHGALEHERSLAQPFELDLTVTTNFEPAAHSDELGDALDYGPVVARAARVVTEQHFALLEALAQAVAEAVLEDARVRCVTVALRKLRPPLPYDVDSVGVRITRVAANGSDGA